MHRLPLPAPRLRPAFFALLLALPFAAEAADAPKSAAAAGDPVVMKINNTEIRKSRIVDLQKGLGQQAASIPLDDFYKRISDRLVVNTLLADAAKAAKLDSDPEVKAQMEKAREQIVTQVFVEHLRATAVSDEKLKALYDKTVKNEAGKPEIHARHILVKTEDEAKAIIADLEKGGDFAKIADEKSTDKGGNGGDLGWFGKDQMVPEFSEAAFKLQKGEHTKTPVKSQFGYHVIEVLDTRVSAPPTFDEDKPKLRAQLENQAIEAKVAELRGKAKIEQFALDGSPLPPPAAAPASAPAPAK
jgi:peptidyl-prolyl cis-trans isomerase C